jgi:hypothetical protein
MMIARGFLLWRSRVEPLHEWIDLGSGVSRQSDGISDSLAAWTYECELVCAYYSCLL